MSSVAVVRGTEHTFPTFWTWRRLAVPLVLVYVLVTSVWTFVVPLGEGPDEPAHFQYVLFLASEGRLPVQGADPSSSEVPGEGHQPPLAYLLMWPFAAWLPPDDLHLPLYGNPEFRWNGGNQINAYLHGIAEQPPYRGVILAWHLARLWSVVLGGVSLLLCAATARRLWPQTPSLALGAAAVVAFNPQWIFQHSLVSNDPLLIALSSLVIYLAVVAAQGVAAADGTASEAQPEQAGTAHRTFGGSWRLPLACGVTLGLMLVTKQSALALAPVPICALWLGRRSVVAFAKDAAIVVVTSAVIAGWWYVRNQSLYGDLLGLHVFQQTFATGDFSAGDWQNWRAGGWNLLRSSWGAFGWLTLPLPNGAFMLAQAVLIVALAGLLASIGLDVWRGRGKAAIVLLLSTALVVCWTVAFALTAGAVAWQGRFLFPAAPALAVLLAVGLRTALPRGAALVALPAVCLILVLMLPWTLIRPAYASPALVGEAVPQGGMYARFDFGWKRAFELHDASFARTAASGGDLRLGLTWHLVEPVDRPWYVFVHLVDDQEEIVAKRDAEPMDGEHPTNTWVPGDWYRDVQIVALDSVAPGTYHLRVGMWDPDTGERLGVYDREGKLRGDLVELGEVVVTDERPMTNDQLPTPTNE